MRTFMIAVLMLAAAMTAPALAQRGAVELGVDGSLSLNLTSDGGDDASAFNVSRPGGGLATSVMSPYTGVRVGFFVSDAVALEPVLTVSHFSSEGYSATGVSGAFKLVVHFPTDPHHARTYVAAGPTFAVLNDEDESASQTGGCFELGTKVPIATAALFRAGVGIARLSESDDLIGQTSLYFIFGISCVLGGS